jgi:hypothetical protein
MALYKSEAIHEIPIRNNSPAQFQSIHITCVILKRILKKQHMKKTLFAACLTLISYGLTAQSILNASFESSTSSPHYMQIHNNFNSLVFAHNWSSPTNASPDLFVSNSSACGNINSLTDNPLSQPCYPQVCTNANMFGSQTPHSGNNYVGLAAGTEYIQTLLNPAGNYFPNGLIAGECYHLKFYASRGDRSTTAVKLQAILSKTAMTAPNTNPMAYTADAIVLTSANFITDKSGWTEVSFDFKATGGEKYLTIGLFDIYSTYDPILNINVPTQIADATAGDCDNSTGNNGCTNCPNYATSYYYLDDVDLYPSGGPNFPNPIVYTPANGNIVTSHVGANILISGNVNIAANVTFANCQVRFNQGSTITVNSGQTFSIINSDLKAGCAIMWNGIKVMPNATIITDNGSNIEDAVTAIRVDNGSWQLSKTVFQRNGKDLVLENVNAATNKHIKQCTFNGVLPLSDPTQGHLGKTKYAIQIINQLYLGDPVNVGGPNLNAINTFNVQHIGIFSEKCDVNVGAAIFNGGFTGIEFIQNEQGIYNKTLTVTNGCQFNGGLLGIFAHQRSNLTVTGSAFANNAQSIAWYDNHNCDLAIGDATNPSLGNSFTGTAYPILLCNNISVVDNSQGTSYSNAIIYNSNSSEASDYTDILIANNQIFGVVGKQTYLGIGVSENPSGGQIAYHTLRIENNLLTEVTKGIELSNVVGMGEILGYVTAVQDDNVPNRIQNNTMSISTDYSPNARGINIRNAPGWKIIANGISSDAEANWQNYGIFIDNSGTSKVQGNAVSAGTGIVLANYTLYSNIHCNSLVNNACGINLVYTGLRPIGGLHGQLLTPNSYEAFNNYFTGSSIPWTVPIQNYYSPSNQNRWVWDNSANSNTPEVWNSATGSFETNLGQSSLISPLQNGNPVFGANNCAYGPVYGGPMMDVPVIVADNVPSNLTDPVAQWIADYYFQQVYNATGLGNNTQASANIKTLLEVEQAMLTGNWTLANSLLAGFVPANTWEQDYKTVLQILQDVQFPETRLATPAEQASLMAIAQQQPRLAGLAVYSARAYLRAYNRMEFEDEEFTEGTIFGTAVLESPCSFSLSADAVLTLMDENNVELPITGAVVKTNGQFTFDPFQMRFYKDLHPTTNYRLVSKAGSKYTALTTEYKTIADWIAVSPVEVVLGGALFDTLTPTQDTTIVQKTLVVDNWGYTYTVGATNTPNADFKISKYDANNQLVWMRTYNGPDSGNDTATCVALDQQGMLYVAGKVWNNGHYDFVTLKYDTSGALIWKNLHADPLGRTNTPTGLGVHPVNYKVYVVGTCVNAHNEVKFFRVEYFQCDPASNSGNARLAQDEPETELVYTPVSFYPNPSDGSIRLQIGQAGGGQVELFSLTGARLFSQEIQQATTLSFSAELVADGIYLLKFTATTGEVHISKLMIQRSK